MLMAMTTLTASMPPKLHVRVGFVYVNAAGEARYVVSIRIDGVRSVVMWQTANPELPRQSKTQGSSILSSFLRWASTMHKASAEEQGAFQKVTSERQSRRKIKAEVRRVRQRLPNSTDVE